MVRFLGGRPGPPGSRRRPARQARYPTVAPTGRPAPGRRRPGGTLRGCTPHRSRWPAHGVAAAVYLALAVALWWGVWTGHPSTTATCGCGDTSILTWFMAWPAYALPHGDSLFFSTRALHPAGINLPANTSFLAISVPLAPVTWLFGPVAVAQRGRHPGPGGRRPVGPGTAAALVGLAAGRLPRRPLLRVLPLRDREPGARARGVRHPGRAPAPLPVPGRAARPPAGTGLDLGPGRRRAVRRPVLRQLRGPGDVRAGRRDRHPCCWSWRAWSARPAAVAGRWRHAAGRPGHRRGPARSCCSPTRPGTRWPARGRSPAGCGPTSSTSGARGAPCSSRPTPRPGTQRRPRDLRLLRQPPAPARLPRDRHGGGRS